MSDVEKQYEYVFDLLIIVPLLVFLFVAMQGADSQTLPVTIDVRDLANTIDMIHTIDGDVVIQFATNPEYSYYITEEEVEITSGRAEKKRYLYTPTGKSIQLADPYFEDVLQFQFISTKNKLNISSVEQGLQKPIRQILCTELDDQRTYGFSYEKSTLSIERFFGTKEGEVMIEIIEQNQEEEFILVLVSEDLEQYGCHLAKSLQQKYPDVPVTYSAFSNTNFNYLSTENIIIEFSLDGSFSQIKQSIEEVFS